MLSVRTAFVATLVLAAAPAMAHFPWLATDEEGRAAMWFGESLTERNYHLPEAVLKADVQATDAKGVATAVSLPEVDEENFIGRRAAKAETEARGLHTTVTYGVYHGAKLVYYAQHDPAVGKTPLTRPVDALTLRAELSRGENGELKTKVYWQAGTLGGATVELLGGNGKTIASEEAGDDGSATFAADALPDGLAAIRVGHMLKDDSGEIDGKPFASAMHYLTATFRMAAEEAEEDTPPAGDLPDLPEPIASFGGAVADGWLYVYSGHTGTAHEHSKQNLSGHFSRIKLDGATDLDTAAWESLPMPQPLQGMPLVTHGGKLYRVGGMEATNEQDDDEAIFSQTAFARFDPATKQWTDLAPLPEARSSHDAVVIGNRLYVVGGWKLNGTSDGEWLDTVWSCELTAANPEWEKAPSPNLRRRAIAAAHLAGNPVVLGGLSEEGDVLSKATMLDLATGEWTELPRFPGKGMSGFGASAWTKDGVLYASGMEGVVYALDDPKGEWRQVAELQTARFFHRLLPAGDKLVVVAGASPQFGHVSTSELVELAE